MEPFQSLHPRDEKLIQRLREFIRQSGRLDDRFRLAVWRLKDKEEGILVDGYNRFEAAELEGLEEVPCELIDFDSVAQAEIYARRSEERRHISDENLLDLARKSSDINDPQALRRPRASQVAQTVEKSGVSPRKVVRARRILRNKHLAADVRAGRKSIRQADEELRAKKKRNRKTAIKPKDELTTLAESILDQAQQMRQKWQKCELNGDPLGLVRRAIRCLQACLPKAAPRTDAAEHFLTLARDLSQISPFRPNENARDALAFFVNQRMELFEGDPGVIELRRDTKLMKDILTHLRRNGRTIEPIVTYYLESDTYMGARRGWDVPGLKMDLQEILKEVPREDDRKGVPEDAAR